MSTHKPFRELVSPNSNFEFVGNIRKWVTLSTLLILGSIAMLFVNKHVLDRGEYLNWSIDFKGGTEVIFGFKGDDGASKAPDTQAVRKALKAKGYQGFSVAELAWTDQVDGKDVEVQGLKITTLEFGAVAADDQGKISEAFQKQFGSVEKINWSGDRIFVRSKEAISWEAAQAFFASQKLELRNWPEEETERFTTPNESTGEYNVQFNIRGIDAQLEVLLEEALSGVNAEVVQTYGVGARAGARLRNDGIRSLFYAMAFIMLYLVVRFDIRYAPGAVVALLHDALLVVGVFALTWQEVSLTTVAALLTVIGYSVNDSVVIFDRIRENVGRLKDKKFPRVINISLNETMGRTLLTSITLFVVTLAMNVLGTGLVRNFAFAMNIGVVVGVYSSVFIASPVALSIHEKWYSGDAPTRKRASSKAP